MHRLWRHAPLMQAGKGQRAATVEGLPTVTNLRRGSRLVHVWNVEPMMNVLCRHQAMVGMGRRLMVMALAWACGDGAPPTASTSLPDPPRPTTIGVSPFAIELTALCETVQLTAEVRDQNARVMTGVTVTWSSSDTSVATVDQTGFGNSRRHRDVGNHG